MKQSITQSVITIFVLLSTISFGRPNLSGEYWFGSIGINTDTNEEPYLSLATNGNRNGMILTILIIYSLQISRLPINRMVLSILTFSLQGRSIMLHGMVMS